VVFLLLWFAAPVSPVTAQSPDVLREQTNRGTVAIITGGIKGTYIQIASDLATLLDKGPDLRILPIVGKGSVQNITDILYLRSIDIGIVQSDVLAYLKKQGTHPTINKRIHFITKLYNEEFHLLAAKSIADPAGLVGKKVNFAPEGSGTFMTARLVFDLLKIEVVPTTFDYSIALEKLRNGEIDGMVYVAGKPTNLFANIPQPNDLHLLAIPFTPELAETYVPGTFTHQDYPRLIAEGERVDTVAVGAIMAAYNWDRQSPRYRKVAVFVETFFNEFPELLKPPFHAKWQEVHLAAGVPGWTRFGAAEDWLKARLQAQVGDGANASDPQLRKDFEDFLAFSQQNRLAGGSVELSPYERADLFDQFVRWRQQKRR
jgi:TRAP transporter TAXI family solute receptor